MGGGGEIALHGKIAKSNAKYSALLSSSLPLGDDLISAAVAAEK
jgi:hypothetical protein